MIESREIEALAGIGLSPGLAAHLQCLAGELSGQPMRVVEVQRDHLLLHDGRATCRASLSQALAEELQAQFDAPAVGDWVLAQQPGPGHWQARQLLPRASQIARRTNDGRGGVQRQVVAANVDTALLVMGLDHDFNLRRLERYVMLAKLAGVAAVLVLTKADTVDAVALEQRLADARRLLPAEFAVVALVGRDAAGATQLGPWLRRGQTLVLLGSSGAGKSTLTNTLTGRPANGPGGARVQSTGAVRDDDGRGRHTTTARSLHLTADGACIIDTPGLRALRLDIDSADDVLGAFDDIDRWSAHCRFRNCRHHDEPGCAVRQAVPAKRLRNFHKLLREASHDSRSALERTEQVAQWKLRHRAAMQRARMKHGG